MKCAVSALGIILFILCLFGFGLQRADAATTWYVDDDALADFNTIQAALDAASDGETIMVRDGTYIDTGNRDIDFNGKAVHLRSENGPEGCIIDAQGSEAELHRGFYFHSGEDENSILDGFTITNGYTGIGAGMNCDFSSSPIIINNRIIGNVATWEGGGIFCHDFADPTIANNTIASNIAVYGGGVFCDQSSSPAVIASTITLNMAEEYGGGTNYQDSALEPVISNCIIWANDAPVGAQIAVRSASNLTVSYTDVHGGQAAVYVETDCTLTWGPGNIDVDPLFADPDNGDYHLKSEDGRWDPAANSGAGAWVLDSVTSPCIDAGDPASDFANAPEPDGGRINMGAYGNTPEASKNRWLITTDANFDDKIDILDLLTVRDKLQEDPTSDNNWRCDVNTDGFINILDLIYVRNHLGTSRR